jgi:hypothetical protein
MKRLSLLALLGFAPLLGHAQEHSFHLGYRYLFAPQWDRMVQTYNFSRPFLDAHQGLLQHGIGGGYARTFTGESRIRYGVTIGYDRFISQADATGLESRIRLHQLRIAYTARILPKDLESPWLLEAGVGLVGSHLSRLVNNAPIEDEDLKPRSMGIGADLNVLVGRGLPWGDQRWVVPYIAVHMAPYVFQPTAEVVLNQTRGLVAGNGTFMLMASAGLRLRIGNEQQRPGTADRSKTRTINLRRV